MSRMMARAAELATRNMRLTVLISVIAICGSFAAAAVLQMQFGRDAETAQEGQWQAMRAADMAQAVSGRLGSYAALGTQFAEGQLSADVLATLVHSAMPALTNIMVLGTNNTVQSSLRAPTALPLPKGAFAMAQLRRTVIAQGNHLILAYPLNGFVVAVVLNIRTLVLPDLAGREALAIAGGEILAHAPDWNTAALPDAIAYPSAANRIARAGNMLIAAAPVPGWPLMAASAFDLGDAASISSTPLYLFATIGLALAGAGLAMLFVSEYERRAHVSGRIRALHNNARGDAQLLIRLADAERRATEAERAKTEFVAHMSHELRTPLNAIVGFAEVIERGFFGTPGHPKYSEYARDIGAAGRALHTKISDVLEFANVEAGHYPIHCSDIDIYAQTCECVNEMAGRAFSRRVSLSLDPTPPIRAHADAVAVKRILGNLLSNALDYTPPEGRVQVLLFRQDNRVCVRIRDTGQGFDPSEATALGQPFVRFDRNGVETGQGLGLAIAAVLAERMKGEVRLFSNHGAGTTAELRLPKA